MTTGSESDRLFPIDALHQHAYCPRRMHLMHVQGQWADNAFTEEGRAIHARVDAEDDLLPVPADVAAEGPPVVGRSVSLSSPTLRLSGKLDLVEVDGAVATPVEFKRGKAPAVPWEPERVQLMAQGLLLREAGFTCSKGVLYFEASRRRVEVDLDDALEARTLALIEEMIAAASVLDMPLPLVDSPKCRGCSLVGICLPDETWALREAAGPTSSEGTIRRLFAPRDDAQPLYVQEQGALVGKSGETLRVTKSGEKLLDARLIDVSHLVLLGQVTVSPSALHTCAERGVPIVHFSTGHWFYGITQGFGLRSAFDKADQFAIAAQPDRRLALGRSFLTAKATNQRTLLRRNGDGVPPETLDGMQRRIREMDRATTPEVLMGLEGVVARAYFGAFDRMLRPRDGDLPFDLDGRNRRPPLSPVNAMLSFAYALLAKDCAIALSSVGLDPHWGLFHTPKHGKPALALDLMEEFRPLVADSAVLTAANNGMVARRDFETNGVAWSLSAKGRKALIRSYELRMDQMVTHPAFGYRLSWRRTLFVQARLLARHLRGEIPSYRGMVTR